MIERLWRRDVPRVHRLSHIGVVVASAVVVVAGQPATAQYSSDFEAPLYAGSADGTILTDQDKFYIPVKGSQDGLVYTYVGNALGLPANPTGGNQFAGVTGGDPGLPVPFARAQRDVVYAGCAGVWTVSFDIAATFIGTLPSAQNIGSFSTVDFPDPGTFIALAGWTDPETAANWNADYVWFNRQGDQLTDSVDDPGFQGLNIDHWYRWSTTFNFDNNQILQVSITDLTTGVTTTNSPSGRYLSGGAGGGGTPRGFRLFGGSGTAAGNTLGFDNISIDLAGGPPLGACCLLDDSCVVLTQADCTAAGGIYSGDGTGCTPITCVDVPEACNKDAGPCNEPNGSPGCEDVECCVLVCDPVKGDPFCCKVEWDQQCADLALDIGCASEPTLASADGLWTAELDNFGQIVNFFPPAQPNVDNVFETFIYEANSQGDMLSRRMETNYRVVEGPTISKDGTSAFTRLEANDADLAIEIEILMLDGLSGGALVKIRCENTGNAAISCKIFYYCDYDISADFGDDEAFTIPDPPDPIFAIEQIDNEGDKGPKPLWFGGCPDYEGWEIADYPVLLEALDGGVAALTNADATPPGSRDHTAALSSATTLLQPGEIVEFQAGLGGVNFVGCPSACPWDLDGNNDVGIGDLLIVLADWGNPYGIGDLLALLAAWGPCA